MSGERNTPLWKNNQPLTLAYEKKPPMKIDQNTTDVEKNVEEIRIYDTDIMTIFRVSFGKLCRKAPNYHGFECFVRSLGEYETILFQKGKDLRISLLQK